MPGGRHGGDIQGIIDHLDYVQELGATAIWSTPRITSYNVCYTKLLRELWLVQKNEEYLAFIEKMDETEVLKGVVNVLDFLKQNQQNIVLGSYNFV